MSHTEVGHQAHAVREVLLRTHRYQVAGHHRPYLKLSRRVPVQYHLPGVVAFGEDADDGVILEDDERADVVGRHLLEGLEDGRVGVNRQDGEALVLQQLTNRAPYLHPGTSVVGLASTLAAL